MTLEIFTKKHGTIFLFFAFSLLTVAAPAQSLSQDKILGVWLTADKTGEIAIYKTKDVYYGKIKSGTRKQKFDVNNPDKPRRAEPLIGLTILKGLKYDKDNVWKDGKVYDPTNGKTYSCTLRMPDNNTLKITGFIGFSWIGRTETWTRIE